MKATPSPQELAQEALEALRSSPMTPREHFDFLVQHGIIDPSGRVLEAKLFGENADAEEPATSPNSSAAEKNRDSRPAKRASSDEA